MLSNIAIIISTTNSKDKWKRRCRELRAYIKFLESAKPIEDAFDGAQWLNERADRRAECDVQDLS